jgi:hypothetical protein
MEALFIFFFPIDLEELLDGHAEHLGNQQCEPHRRVVAPPFDGEDRLPRDAGSIGELLLGDIGCPAVATDMVQHGIPAAHERNV